MELRHLRYFIEIVEAQSITRAATRLARAQPGLSQLISKLEEEIGHILLVRHARGIEPTQAGYILYRHAKVVLTQIETAFREIDDLSVEPRGLVRLGLPPSISHKLAIPLLKVISVEFPLITLRLVESMSETIHDLLNEGELELACSFNPQPNQTWEHEELFQQTLYCVQSRHRGLLADTINCRDALSKPLVLPSRPHNLRISVDTVAEKLECLPHIVHEADSVGLILDLVTAQMGATILPMDAFEVAIQERGLAAALIIDPEISRRLYLSFRKMALPRTVQVVAECVRREIHEPLAQTISRKHKTL
jgi:DNA-binding transcriptional LysR family regulator